MLKRNPKILIPNFFTSLNMIIGMTSIFYAIKGDYINAGWLILLGGVMDKLDGTAARFFKVSTGFGVEFDSFSDFVSFAFAPALLVFSYYSSKGHSDLSDPGFYVIVACAVYVLFSAIRLAKYNSVQAEDKHFFYGLTTTQSGGMIAAYMIFAVDNDISFLLDINLVSGMVIAQAFLLLIPFKYPKISKPKSKINQVLMVLGFAVFVMLVLIRKLPWLIYIIGAVVVIVGTYKSRKVIYDLDEQESDEEIEHQKNE